jgi:CheY-like chemotaxis protein
MDLAWLGLASNQNCLSDRDKMLTFVPWDTSVPWLCIVESNARLAESFLSRFSVVIGSKNGERTKMKKRILLVDDEVAVLLTLKAVLEINGFDVDTAASARDGKLKLRSNEYQMVISDMRMESEQAGAQVIAAARSAPYKPVVALLTAYPLADEDWQEMGADKMLVKPMHTRLLLEQIDRMMKVHAVEQSGLEAVAKTPAKTGSVKKAMKKIPVKKPIAQEVSIKPRKAPAKKAAKAKKTPRRAVQ